MQPTMRKCLECGNVKPPMSFFRVKDKYVCEDCYMALTKNNMKLGR